MHIWHINSIEYTMLLTFSIEHKKKQRTIKTVCPCAFITLFFLPKNSIKT